MSNTNHSPTELAGRILSDGVDSLSIDEMDALDDNPTAVAENLPRPMGLALFAHLEQPVPSGYRGLPPRLGKVGASGLC